MTEKEIIEKIKKGNTDLFEILIDQNKDLIFRVAMGFVHNKYEAEDITQEVFIKLWENIKYFEPKAKISTWLYRVTANMSINYLKRKKINTLFSDLSKKLQTKNETKKIHFEKADSLSSAERMTENKELSQILKKAISTLPKRQRIAFILNKYQNMNYKDIAEVMNLSYPAVDSLINRAKKNLQKKLLKYKENEL